MATSSPHPPAAPELAAPPAPELEAPERAAAAIEDPAARLSPADLDALNQTWRDCVLFDDDESRATARRVVARLRRATHLELHPGCDRVVVDVPQLPDGRFVRINARQYIGPTELWMCEAQTILELVWHARAVETARLRDDGRTVDLDREALAARARLIQAA